MEPLANNSKQKCRKGIKKTKVVFLFSILIFLASILNLHAQSIGYKMAVVEKNGYVSENDLLVKRFDNLLQQLDKKYIDDKQQIADKTVTAKQILEEKGIKESMIKMMEGMNTIYDTKNKYKKYNEYLSCYLILRIQGRNHDETIKVLQSLLNSLGIQGLLKSLGIN